MHYILIHYYYCQSEGGEDSSQEGGRFPPFPPSRKNPDMCTLDDNHAVGKIQCHFTGNSSSEKTLKLYYYHLRVRARCKGSHVPVLKCNSLIHALEVTYEHGAKAHMCQY